MNVHWTSKAPDRDKPFWTGRATRSVKEALNTVQWAVGLPETRDVYLCLSSQRTAQPRTSAKGKEYLLPVRSQDNAVALKSLFLDIDIKPESGYPDVKTAVAALAEFLKATGLPKPTMVVGSGGGMHVYWCMSRALMPHEWQPLADALADAAKEHGLKCDTVCTVDAARILRVPDTFNRKQDPARPVRLVGKMLDFDYSVERLQKSLEPYLREAELPALPPQAPLAGPSDLTAGIEGKASPVDLDSVAKECPTLKEAIDTGGKDFANPLWNLTTLTAVFTVGGRADAHRMADQHPGYSKESTDELFERKERDKEAKGLGWPSCRSFELAGSTKCAGCPHKAAGKTPLHYASKPQAAPVPATPGTDLPKGYGRDKNNHVCLISIDEAGNPKMVPIIDYPMIDPWLQRNPWILNFTTTTHTGHQTQIALPLLACSTKEGVPKELSRQGLVIHEYQIKTAREFFVSWITTLQKSKNAVIASSPFGWNTRNGKTEGFVYNNLVITPTGDRPAAVSDPVIAQQYTPSGDLQPWLEAAKMVTDQKRPALDTIIASAFAAPLVKIVGMEGCLLSAYSQESGIGKTTALKVAQAVWGDPLRAMQGLSDTQLSVLRKMGELQNLPIYWDELKTDEDTKKFVALTFQLTGGKEKSRLNASIEQRSVGTWQTMLVVASNESLVDHVTSRTKMTTAGLYRIFEYAVTPGTHGQIDPSKAQRIIAKLNHNFGQVGLAYARYLGSNFEAIDAELAALEKEIGDKANFAADERFWRATIACLCMGARYANKLGFTAIDEKAMQDFLLKVLDEMRLQRKETHVDMKNTTNVSTVIAQFLNASRAKHTLFTNRIHVSKGKPAKDAIQVKRDTSKLDGVYVHIGLEDKLMRISHSYLGDWLVDKGYTKHMFMRAIEDQMGSQRVVGRIGSGTDFAGPTEYLIQIDLTGTPVINFLEEA